MLPKKVIDRTSKATSVLVVGLGGGFDSYASLPIILEDAAWEGVTNFSAVSFSHSKEFLVRHAEESDYPAYQLRHEGLFNDSFVIGRVGVQPVIKALKHIVEVVEPQVILAVDGGVDSLMQGDEYNKGTVLEDYIALAACNAISGPEKILACVGFGCETEEELNHFRALENMAALTKAGHFLGAYSWTADSPAYRTYANTCKKAMEVGRKSHVQTKIMGAVEGEFGDYHMYSEIDPLVYNASTSPYFVSPLMSICWFYDLAGVASCNKVLKAIEPSASFTDAMSLFRQAHSTIRSKEIIPL